MSETEKLIPKHGGYRKLKSFQIAQLIYDVTVRFCECYIEKRSRTHDQMVQAARSGVQNIAEGSQASGTSKKSELKLTNVARASLEELRLDYEDYLRQRGAALWEPGHPALVRFKARRCKKLEEVREWVKQEQRKAQGANEHEQALTKTNFDKNKHLLASGSVPIANAALSLLNLCCNLLDRQLTGQARQFEQEGGFTERLYRKRQQTRRRL